MAFTYSVKNGELVLKTGKAVRRNDFMTFVCRFLRFGGLFLVFAFTCAVTWAVFRQCISQPSLEDTISLGAVFATLGSAIVSVLTLFCGEQYSQFCDNIKILQSSLLGTENWERWPFVERTGKRKISKGHYEYLILVNPCVIFSEASWNVMIPLPTSKTDFYELPVYRCFFRLRHDRRVYRGILSMRPEPEAIEEVLVWDCLACIYKNILLYRFGQSLIWLGGCFVFCSIIFSFFYNYYSLL